MLLTPPPPLESVPSPSCVLGHVSVQGVTDRTVIVKQGAITEVREARPDDDRRFAGCVVTPGLIDSHQHLPPANALKLSGLFCLLNLLHGVTTVLDAGDATGTAVPAARQLIADGLLPGPRVVACGPFVGRPPAMWPNTFLVQDPVTPAVIVQAAIDRGAQAIKLYEGLTVSDIAAIASEASARGLLVIGHVPAALDVETAGVPEVQHFFGVPAARSRSGDGSLLQRLADWHAVDDARLDTVVEASVTNGISHTPTLVVTEGVLRAHQQPRPVEKLLPRVYSEVVWHPEAGIPTYRNATPQDIARTRDSLPIKLDLLGRLHRAGVPVYVGTDVNQPYVVPGASLRRELQLFADSSIPPATVMDIATVQAGKRLRIPQLGTIAIGAPADLLVLDRDPCEDISALDSLRAVVSAGRLLEVAVLNDAVDRQLHHYGRLIVDRASMFAARRTLRQLSPTQC
jgi:imidazolonepropionase-like amidohydrolase